MHEPHTLVCVGHLVEGHTVELDGLAVLAHPIVDVAHVDAQPPGVIEHAVLGDDLVGVEGLRVHVVSSVLVRQVEEDLIREEKTPACASVQLVIIFFMLQLRMIRLYRVCGGRAVY